MSDHFLVRAGQTLVLISCSLKFERMGFPGIRARTRRSWALAQGLYPTKRLCSKRSLVFPSEKMKKLWKCGNFKRHFACPDLSKHSPNSGGKIMLPNLPATKFGAHLYQCRTITWLESSVPVLISKDRTRTEYDFGSSFGTRIGIETKTNPIFGTGTGSKIRLIGFRS